MKTITSFLGQIALFPSLDKKSKRLALSILFYNLASPFLDIFINAYLWQLFQNVSAVIIYNLAITIFLPIGFYLNGKLLRWFTIGKLYSLGNILYGLSVAGLFILRVNSLYGLVFYGILIGITSGIFWANRNYLTVKETTNTNRVYFCGINQLTATFANVLMPAIIGWIIGAVPLLGIYDKFMSYNFLAIISVILLILSGILENRQPTSLEDGKNILLLNKPSPIWKEFRKFVFILGIKEVFQLIIPIILILILAGQEDVLGSVKSIGFLLSAILVYFLSKKVKMFQSIRFYLYGTMFYLVSSIILALSFSRIGIIIFTLLTVLGTSIESTMYLALSAQLVEGESGNDDKRTYSSVSNQELYLNLGRSVMMIIFLIVLGFFSLEFSVRFLLGLTAIAQIILVFQASRLGKIVQFT